MCQETAPSTPSWASAGASDGWVLGRGGAQGKSNAALGLLPRAEPSLRCLQGPPAEGGNCPSQAGAAETEVRSG